MCVRVCDLEYVFVIWGGYDYSPLNYRSLLQKSFIKETIFCKKRPIILRSLLIVAIPYEFCMEFTYEFMLTRIHIRICAYIYEYVYIHIF